MRLLLILIATLCFFGTMRATIIETYTLSDILSHLEEETWLFFDVDETLTVAADALLTDSGRKWRRENLLSSKLPFTEQIELFSLSIKECTFRLIETQAPQIVASAKEKGCVVFALTLCPADQFGLIEDMGKWRCDHLEKLGFIFTELGPRFDISSKNCPTLPTLLRGEPHCARGVVFCGHYRKGPVLINFLELVGGNPRKIIFVDNLRSNVECVEAACASLRIPFVGFHYRAVENAYPDFDPKVAQLQLEFLQKERRWLSDEAARHMLGQEAVP